MQAGTAVTTSSNRDRIEPSSTRRVSGGGAIDLPDSACERVGKSIVIGEGAATLQGSVQSSAELPGLIIAHRLHDLVCRVHHERAVLRDGLSQRLPADQQRTRSCRCVQYNAIAL